ncbi:type IIG restriction enzyme/methyltransferase [Pedobacter deserti]|uniref:type IIG restriction enzyme/methyltransferase n=1 Tax=Pedobacter deserti TaxID=2817382 RepID=UPI00210BB770|nr:Eco57I restriction-modification methylase domain-containing protein [Pedobacter sp. SYSU D00382]
MINLIIHSPKKALKAFVKQKPLRSEIDIFKLNLAALLDKISVIENRPKDESEEHLKNDIRDFLRDTYYRDSHAINTKDKKDLVVHIGKSTVSEVGVIIEAKRPNNTNEMITAINLNKKAMHELILYYLDERSRAGNNQLKKLVITNIYEWYIIDANYFDKYIYRNTAIKRLYDIYINDRKDNPFFYEEIRKILANLEIDLPCVYFDIREYTKIINNNNNKKDDDKQLSALFRVLSPQYLLKVGVPNDGNSLNEKFYKELLHLIGLEEAKENNKAIIRRKKEGRHNASLIEATIDALKTEDVLHHVPDLASYGTDLEARTFTIALELCITWVNRILFLKLLEGQLQTYHYGDEGFRFLNSQMIPNFKELYKLFHKVLAVPVEERTENVKTKYAFVPYLNSSLFDISELEDQTVKIQALDQAERLPLFPQTVLKEAKKDAGTLPTLDYIFQFLDAYDFASEGDDTVQEENKTIISASVLGTVFEKINGYKDGSIFTPAFITMYMCKRIIREAIVAKFNDSLAGVGKKLFDDFKDLRNYTRRLFKSVEILEANQIINSIKICDPAVGSGHFLVSALNEIIHIKAELGILADHEGNSISNYEFDIINDELVITDPKGNLLGYKLKDGKPVSKDIQHLQKTLFHEKQLLIENCLFGVDINPNSVKICRLRLWIELLKNAYYKEETSFSQLETLPNIDINIKTGNSLLSRFKLDADLTKALKSVKYDIKTYRDFVDQYKNEKSREVKRDLQGIINSIKADFKTEIHKTSKDYTNWYNAKSELDKTTAQLGIFELNAKEKKKYNDNIGLLTSKLKKFSQIVEDIKNNAIYKNAFEWRFEFPEVLKNNGEFEGFDVIIGNPPYIQLQKLNEEIKKGLEQQNFKTFGKTGDIYQLFYEHGLNLLKEGGRLAFITSNKWMRTDYGDCTREYLATKCRPTLVVDFGMKQIFESATTYTNMLFFEKAAPPTSIKMCRVNDKFDMNTILEEYIDYFSVDIDNPGKKSWVCYQKAEYKLIKKIVEQGKPLKEWDIKINRGILTGCNEAFIVPTKIKEEIIMKDPKSAELIKPLLRGEDIKAYVPEWNDLWLIGTFPALKIDIDQYPGIKEHLMQFRERIEPKPKNYNERLGKWKGRKSGSYKWFETQDSIAYYEDFLKPKIIYPNMTKYLPFVYDKHQFFTNDKSFILSSSTPGYLTAFLNSKLFKFAFKDYFPELLGDTREIRKIFFETITIKPPIKTEIFDQKVISIEQQKAQNLSTIVEENEINKLIFEHYDLTSSEISIIEESSSLPVVSDKFTSLISSSVSI